MQQHAVSHVYDGTMTDDPKLKRFRSTTALQQTMTNSRISSPDAPDPGQDINVLPDQVRKLKLRRPQTTHELESLKLRDAVPPPDGYCYTLDGRLVPLLEVQVPIEDPQAQELFCIMLEKTGNFQAACDTLGQKKATVKRYIDKNPSFFDAVEAAAERHRQSLYAFAVQRATVGVQNPVFNKEGEVVGYETKHSDALLTLLLKRHFPEFREKAPSVQVTNNNLTVIPNIENMSREDRLAMKNLILKSGQPSAEKEAIDVEPTAEERRILSETDN